MGNLYTHHQKCVLVDTQASQNTRKITAFIGGLDLCDGRYDTPRHRLFKDLNTVFLNDFHNPTFSVSVLSVSINVSFPFEDAIDHMDENLAKGPTYFF